jgi:hypothetical protein
MTFKFEIEIEDDGVLRKHFAAMEQSHIDACVWWLEIAESAARAGSATPSTSLLLKGIPRGPLRGARPILLNGKEYIAFTVTDRTERLVDPAAFCCMRLMALPGGDCEWFFDRSTDKNLPLEMQRLYLRFTRQYGLWAFRIFADAQPGEVIRQRLVKSKEDHWGFRDLRFINFFRTTRMNEVERGKPMAATYKGREMAIAACLENFGDSVHGVGIARDDYKSLLNRSFAFLDRLHACEIEDRRQKDNESKN